VASKPIFLDATGKRAARVSVIGWSAAIISTLAGIAFVLSLLFSPHLDGLRLRGEVITHELETKSVSPGLLPSAVRLAEAAEDARQEKREISREKRLLRQYNSREAALRATLQRHTGRPLSIAFFPNWEADAYDSLKLALPKLDWVMPTWLTLHGPKLEFKDTYNQRVYDLVRSAKKNVAILPVIQNATLGAWDGNGMAKLLADPRQRRTLEKQIATFLGEHKLQGIVVDFETMPDTDAVHGAMAAFLSEMRASFKKHGWVIAVASPFADDKWPFAQFAKLSDYVLLMAYDQHGAKGGAGSIAGQDWYENLLDKRMNVLDANHTIVALGNYAYDWNGEDVDSLSFEESVIAANDSEAKVDFDDATNNPHFSYVEDDGTTHNVWLLDAATVYNEIHAADPYRPAGYALWRLGSEDPSTWSVMGRAYNAPAPDALKQIPIVEDIDYEGQGEILRVEAHPQSGARSFVRDAKTGDIDDETYTKLPTGYVIRQFGAAKKKVALTFDDGPDAEWTPQILDILAQKHVKATFFIIGGNAEANPSLVQRIVDEGHEVGNHTYTHPNLSDTPVEATVLELTATQRLFQALTGHSLRLFRPPYLGDAEPTDADQIDPVQTAQDLGYLTVGEHVDPVDWERPGVAKIVKETLDQIHGARGDSPRNIVLFHDAGGDREQTVEALPIVIDRLRAEGYSFVRVSNLAGLTPAQAMPPLPLTVSLLTDRAVFMTMSEVGFVLHWAFFAAIWLGVARLLFLIGMALWNRRRERAQSAVPAGDMTLPVSVIIPAYNEETVIASTVRGILQSTYKNLDVIVVDDGSKDNTFGVLRENFENDARVTLIHVPNGGKANALNVGLAKARGDIVVALDADTHFNRDAIARLVRWFGDETIGAVAGNAKVGNRINMITRWQALEYIVAQNLERRALAALGTMTVVPGAIGAWRKSAVDAIGGFPADTLAEDQDLTIALQGAGYRVIFDASAVAWTEAPDSFRGLAKQRFRWSYGTLQCLWKHRAMMFRPKFGTLGMIALPQVWMFQILLTALAPFADLLLLWQLAWEGIAYVEHGAEFTTGNLQVVGLYYAIFVLVDLMAAFAGFLMEKREQWSLLWWLVLQRFGYRQLMYYVVVRSLMTAARGAVVGWGKLERTATVDATLAREHR
jgi:cellulose synthase/poly-beta-1,6-N-acetylglucosamine synthase-like glycosyltransferase/peptidoglycan/xylan/chitin deacetylase (PgdA/CDA1 family)